MRNSIARAILRRLALFSADACGLLVPFLVVRREHINASLFFYKIQPGGAFERVDSGLDWYILLIFLTLTVLGFAGFYGVRKSVWDEVFAFIKSFFFMIIFDAVVLFLAGYSGGVLYFFMAWVLGFFSIIIMRFSVKYALKYFKIWQVPTVVIGSDTNIERAVDVVSKQETVGYAIQRVIQLSGGGAREAGGKDSNISVFEIEEAISYLSKYPHVHVVMAMDEKYSEDFYKISNYLSSRPNTLDLIPSIKGLPLYGVDVIHLFGQEILLIRFRNNLARFAPRLFKRIFDVMISLLLMIVLLPVFIVLAVIITTYDGGNPLYKQLRVGKNGKLFPCYKFRSMHIDADKTLERWERDNPELYKEYKEGNFKLRNDPRVTRVGRFIRAHSLDELPQLINVLFGQMALIGPRPLIAREVAEYGDGIIHYYRARPGITGLWQVSGRSKTRFIDRATYDEWYVKNWSVWLDIVILLKTVGVVIGRNGAY